MSRDSENQDKQTRRTFKTFLDFSEEFLSSPFNSVFVVCCLALIAFLVLLLFKIFFNLDTPISKIFPNFLSTNSVHISWFVSFFLMLFYAFQNYLQKRARTRERTAAEVALKMEREAAIVASQKEHIRILDGFEPPKSNEIYHDDGSIYSAFISTLTRLKNHKARLEASGAPHDVCILLCSPAFDYLRDEYKKETSVFEKQWGKQFIDLLTDVITNKQLNFDICYLPLGSKTGINAMHNFLSGLATYLSDSSSVSPEKKFVSRLEVLEERTKDCDSHIKSWIKLDEKRIKLKDHMVNVPFQIILIKGKNFQEVVVSFAGREVLERKQLYALKGFFSSDPKVVQTFYEIFNTYVESPERTPYIPLHTLEIIKKHDKEKDHLVPSFYNGLVKNLRVSAGTFSPAIGNSTKFTVWLIEKLLTTGSLDNKTHWRNSIKKILDVGAGTGVLALATGAAIREHCKRSDYKIVAIDACPHALKLLKANCDGDKNIEVRPLKLCFEYNDKTGKVSSAWFEDENKERESSDGEFSGFNLIISDLPFVHAEKQKSSDNRFLDLNHRLHQALMFVCSNSSLLAQGGLLLTAFSSLGGADDITDFERHIRENELQVIQRVDFYESGLMWMVYLLMKKSDYENNERLWWDVLDAGDRKPWVLQERRENTYTDKAEAS